MSEESYKKSIESLKYAVEIQCADGNWNHDPYMHGMANGMIFTLSLLSVGRPKYLDAPDIWLKDVPDITEPIKTRTG